MDPSTILQLALAVLPLITTGVPQFINWLESIKTSLQQSGEWTDEQEQAFRAAIMLKMNDPAYKPDPE